MDSIEYFIYCFAFSYLLNLSASDDSDDVAEKENAQLLDYEDKDAQIVWDLNNGIEFEYGKARNRRHTVLATERINVAEHFVKQFQRNQKQNKDAFLHQVMKSLNDKINQRTVEKQLQAPTVSNRSKGQFKPVKSKENYITNEDDSSNQENKKDDNDEDDDDSSN